MGNAGSDGRVLRIEAPPAPEFPQPRFDQTNPLAAPADGNVFLFIDDLGGTADSTFVAVNTGVSLVAGNTYSIVAATGHANGEVLANQSIQAWSTPDGTIAGRQFIGQSFSTTATWNSADEGGWIDNDFSFVADADDVGEELIILITNFGGAAPGTIGTAYWDNFRVLLNGGLVFQDGFEIGLEPGQEAEVFDAGWNIGNSSVANSGVAAALGRPGDYNHDGVIDAADYVVWRNNLGDTGMPGIPGDGSGPTFGVPDGNVNQLDYILWKAAFGSGPGGTGRAAAVPEPSAHALFFLGFLLVNLRTRISHGYQIEAQSAPR
jgi:hypothetical protein